jgi:DNA-binding MarR family transcriptional regulator
MNTFPDQAACQVLEVVPLVMRAIRTQVQYHGSPGLSVSQFRALTFLEQHEGASLSDVAGHAGVVLPSMSKLVEGLVVQKLVSREFCAEDRRCVMLKLTPHGRALLHVARASTQAYLIRVFETLPPSECLTLVEAMEILRPLFTSERAAALASVM